MSFSTSAQASNDFLTGRKPVPNAAGIELIAQRFSINLATADLAAAVIGAIGILPGGHVPVAIEFDAAQLDSNGAPTWAFSVGILNAAGTALSTAAADGGAAWLTGQTIGRLAGGSASGPVASRPMKTVVQSSIADRQIGLLVTGAALTAVAGDFNVTLYYRAS
jgi:hypothetical protein